MSKREYKIVCLKDYSPPPLLIDSVKLSFELSKTGTRVTSVLQCRRNPESSELDKKFVLYGEYFELVSVARNGELLTNEDYELTESEMCLADGEDDHFELEIVTIVNPRDNTALEGLYLSGGNYCTQCEAEGFRRITYFPDRPDVMSVFTTTIIADKKSCPVLLANGNLVESGDLDDGFHYATWQDPFRKPCYLFALVAGDLVRLEDRFKTMSGRDVALHIYVEKRNSEKCSHAMISLKKSMDWDERVYGREYDLDIYMIVAVDDFNMGAMENKGLNVFNSKYVLARPETATDKDFEDIEGVIGHEYFHNWTGNRITCRDWFQLSLKEGLTVFRDQEFSADMTSRAVKRIRDVSVVRNLQFQEDRGPMAHPVRPDSYMEINNFYTFTVYNKGAEVVRMLRTILGEQIFRAGMDLYFARHDGQAVTCDDFVQCMAEAGEINLSQFMLWYSQSGTPELKVDTLYREEEKQYVLTVSQTTPPTPGQTTKNPFFIPVTVGLLNSKGNDICLRMTGESEETNETTRVLHCNKEKQKFVFENVSERPILSFLRNFSAPVCVKRSYEESELAFLMTHDSDFFNRWEAGQQLGLRYLLQAINDYRSNNPVRVHEQYISLLKSILSDEQLDPAFRALLLEIPQENWIGQQMEIIDPEAVFWVRESFRREIARNLRQQFLRTYKANHLSVKYEYDQAAAGRRTLKNLCLDYLLAIDGNERSRDDMLSIGMEQYFKSDNMTDIFAALRFVVNTDREKGDEILDDFYQKWRSDPLVVDKWLSVQASCILPGTLNRVKSLMNHKSFSIKNPNKVRALLSTFCSANQRQFHSPEGQGYSFLADCVLALDQLNPQIASRLIVPLTFWRRFNIERQEKMRVQLERIVESADLSKDVHEMASKSIS